MGGGWYNWGMKKHKLYKGFTIIEVVLVLAIAGLIFLMVFLALPALQRAQRDTQRKQDVAMVVTALHNWKANNQGRGYAALGNSKLEEKRSIAVVINQGCNNMETFKNGDVTLKDRKPGTAAVIHSLESGGAYCQEA